MIIIPIRGNRRLVRERHRQLPSSCKGVESPVNHIVITFEHPAFALYLLQPIQCIPHVMTGAYNTAVLSTRLVKTSESKTYKQFICLAKFVNLIFAGQNF